MPRRIASIALLATLLAGLLLAHLATRTPAPVPADAPPTAFSAERAMDDVRAIARRPHPTGSAENRRVRDYLVARLRSLGLQVRVAPVRGRPSSYYRERIGPELAVENIVAVLPGRSRIAPALAIMSHYDSVPESPGAADDAAGVAASLEIARALAASGRPPARDVVFLITDGEEMGLVGAAGFFPSELRPRLGPPDPLSRRIGAVLNLEARGGGGRVHMFETGPGNAAMVEVLRRHGARPTANSLAVYVYENFMGNGTDFNVTRALDIPGLNYAFIGRPAQYHEPSSTPENLDRGSLQHFGDQVHPVARALAFAPELPRPAPNAVYSDVLGAVLIAYPAWAGWLVLAACVVLAAAGWRRAPHWRDVLRGVLGAVALLLLTALALRGGLMAAGGMASPEALYENFALYESALGFLCLAVALLVFAVLERGRREGAVSGVWFGFVLVGFALAAALQIAAPTTAHTAAWPTLLACAAAAVAAPRPERRLSLIVAALVGALAVGQVGSWAHGIAVGIAGWAPEALALFALLAAIPLAPLLLLAFGRRRDLDAAAAYAGRGRPPAQPQAMVAPPSTTIAWPVT